MRNALFPEPQNPRGERNLTSPRVRTDPRQVRNDAGGYVYSVGEWEKLRRFMQLGTETGTFYGSQRKLTREMVTSAKKCIAENGMRVAIMAKDIISERKAPRPDFPLYILAMVSVDGDENSRRCVLDDLRTCCNIPSHLFLFLTFREKLGGKWNRMLRKGVAKYFNTRHPNQIMYHYLKYRQRYGYSHQDLMRLAHPEAIDVAHNDLFGMMANPDFDKRRSRLAGELVTRHPLFDGFTQLRYQARNSVKEAAGIVTKYRLTREMIPSEYLKTQTMWKALLKDIPIHALLRNLTNLGSHGVLAPGKFKMIELVTKHLEERIEGSVVHPVAILLAAMEYGKGKGRRGKTWTPVPEVQTALNTAFYKAFDNIVPTGKRILCAIDVSASMRTRVADVPDLEVCAAAGLMAMSFVRSEKHITTVAFNTVTDLFDLRKTDDLQEVGRKIHQSISGSTDCGSPIQWAWDQYKRGHEIIYDAIVLCTDSQTWSGRIGKPYEKLQQYRRHVNPDAKLVTIQMESNEFTIAPPDDEGVLNVLGFDPQTPRIVSEFINRDYGEVDRFWEQKLIEDVYHPFVGHSEEQLLQKINEAYTDS